MNLLDTFWQSTLGTIDWTWKSMTLQVPANSNYFWGLILISLAVWIGELVFPWRKNQAIFRQDFWMDGFYMFFNFFLFSIFISGFYSVLESILKMLGIEVTSLTVFSIQELPEWGQLIIFFILLDFVQWGTHILLHKIPALWQFHKVHHSVKEMGFAAHLRYHWMENILYKPAKTIGVMVLGGFEPSQAFIVHFFAISIGHINHSNIKITWGFLKYVFNNPVMHLWHHAKALPENKSTGVNFGISLSVWDYLFRTNYVPTADGDTELGFKHDDNFPKKFKDQFLFGFTKSRK